MKREIEIRLSKQAEDLLNEMPNINREELIDWFVSRGISIGGGNIADFLMHRKQKSQ